MRPSANALISAATLAAFASAGCHKQPSVEAKNASVESVAKQVAASDLRPRPGRWESSFKLEKMEMGAMPPQAKEAIERSMNVERRHVSCLTPDQASKIDGSFIQKVQSGCTYDHFSLSGGTIDAKMVCNRAGGQQTMTTTGSYTADSYQVTTSTSGEMRPGMPMNMTLAISAQRVGDCNGTEDK